MTQPVIIGRVLLTTAELQKAFGQGRKAAQRGDGLKGNPYRPASDGDLWRAWNKGFADRGESKEVRLKRNRVKAVVAAHGELCWLCHRKITNGDLTMDHVVPRSKGGRATRDNLRPAHSKCNVRRGNGPPPELLLRPDMALSPRSKPVGGNPPQSGVPCEARERDQRQLEHSS